VAALLDLCEQLPAAVVGRLLGLSSSTVGAWSCGGVQTGYAAHVARDELLPAEPVGLPQYEQMYGSAVMPASPAVDKISFYIKTQFRYERRPVPGAGG
jgi:hypothetical protein